MVFDPNRPMRMSASRLKTWMRCSLQAKFKYVDGLPEDQNSSASFGKAVHTALDDYDHHENIEQAKIRFGHEWEVALPKIEVWSRGTTFGGLRERGIKMLEAYHEAQAFEDRNVLATEHPFIVPMGKYELNGFVDLVEMRKNERGEQEIHIVDFKTGRRSPTKFQLVGDVQFSIYAYAATTPEFWVGQHPEDPNALCDLEMWEEHIKPLPIIPVWYHLDNNKRIEAGVRTQKDFERIHQCCVEIEKALMYDVYVPDISGENCNFCSYKEPCGLPYVEEDTF